MGNPIPNRGGAVVFNWAGQVLVVSSLANTNEWVLPKGHMERNESTYDAAEREVLEEAGLKVSIDILNGPIGTTEWMQARVSGGDEYVVTEWWRGLARKIEHMGDGRGIQWLPAHIALEVISFPELRNILRNALCIPQVETSSIIHTPIWELSNIKQ